MSRISSVAQSGIWSAILQWSRLGLNAIVFLILSRWLSLSDIGAAAAAQAPILFFQMVLLAVIPDTVVQEKDASDRSLSTLFWISIGAGVVLSTIIFLGAGIVADLIKEPRMAPYLRALSPCPLLIAAGSVFDGLLRKALETRQLAVRTTVATSFAGLVSIWAGSQGFGGWAIILFTLTNVTIGLVILVLVSDWRPKAVFSRHYARSVSPIILSLFGRYAISAAVLPLILLMITASIGAAGAGIFQVAQRAYALVDSVTVTPIRFVSLPLFARKGDAALLSERLRKAISISALIGLPAYLGLLAVSGDLLPLLIGHKNGFPAVSTLQALCIYGPASLMIGLINSALTSRGQSIIVFYRTLMMVVLTVIPCLIATQYSVLATALTYSLTGGGFGLLLGLGIARKFLDIAPRDLLGPAIRPAIAASVMGAATFALGVALSAFPPMGRLIILVIFGGLTYVTMIFLIARPTLYLLRDTFLHRKAGRSSSAVPNPVNA